MSRFDKPCRWALTLVAATMIAVPGGMAWGFLSLSDANEDEDWEESEVQLPDAPNEADFTEFSASAASNNRFFVDASSLEVGADGVVRYVLVVRTSGGASNVTYEGLRCASRSYRIYAMGDARGGWREARRSDWEPIGTGSLNNARGALASDHFCNGRMPPRSREAALRGLRDGLDRW